jgi:hypothetical protein
MSRYPSWKEQGVVDWEWTTHDKDRGGRHLITNSSRATLINGRIIDGECYKTDEGLWHLEYRCVNDPANPPAKVVDVDWVRDGGIVMPGIKLIQEWAFNEHPVPALAPAPQESRIPDIWGAAEVAAELGIAVSNIDRTAGMPAPVAELSATRVWLADDVRAFKAQRER